MKTRSLFCCLGLFLYFFLFFELSPAVSAAPVPLSMIGDTLVAVRDTATSWTEENFFYTELEVKETRKAFAAAAAAAAEAETAAMGSNALVGVWTPDLAATTAANGEAAMELLGSAFSAESALEIRDDYTFTMNAAGKSGEGIWREENGKVIWEFPPKTEESEGESGTFLLSQGTNGAPALTMVLRQGTTLELRLCWNKM